MRSSFYFWVLACLFLPGCQSGMHKEPPEARLLRETIVEWNSLFLELEQHTEGYRSPISARVFAYTSGAAYETALPAMPEHLSLTTQWVDLQRSGMPVWGGGEFFVGPALNAAYSACAKQYFPTAPALLMKKADALDQKLSGAFSSLFPGKTLLPSEDFGKKTALAFWNWSQTDSIGHDAFLYNFDRSYIPLKCPGCWEPSCERPMPSLLPHWGKTRSFIVQPGDIAVRDPIAWDTTPGSAFYREAMEVYSMADPNNKETVWVAEFWRDDVDGLTLTSAGRWISIANQAIQKTCPPLEKMLETYLRLSIAESDAGVLCWDAKYRYNTARPEIFIQEQIAPGWEPIHPAPCFPGYPSGHAIFGSASASILTKMFGDDFEITDNTHKGRQEFFSTPRKYQSFKEMADENALSRVLMGVHYRMDCEEGLRLGERIGEKVWEMRLKRSDQVEQKMN